MIVTQRTGYGIPHAVACRALGVSQAWFYKWRGGDVSASRMRRRALARLVRCVFAAHRGTYGSPRITAELRALGWRVSKNTVAALMAEQHLVARPRRRRRALTKRSACARKAPDLLKRDFAPPPTPNVRWVGDLTDIPNDEGALYLAAVTDLHSRRVVGFALGEHHDARLAKAALCMAIAVRGGRRRRRGVPLRPGRRVHRRPVRPGLPPGRGPALDGPHRVGAGQRVRGVAFLHIGVRAPGP
jgi:putative transposase